MCTRPGGRGGSRQGAQGAQLLQTCENRVTSAHCRSTSAALAVCEPVRPSVCVPIQTALPAGSRSSRENLPPMAGIALRCTLYCTVHRSEVISGDCCQTGVRICVLLTKHNVSIVTAHLHVLGQPRAATSTVGIVRVGFGPSSLLPSRCCLDDSPHRRQVSAAPAERKNMQNIRGSSTALLGAHGVASGPPKPGDPDGASIRRHTPLLRIAHPDSRIADTTHAVTQSGIAPLPQAAGARVVSLSDSH